MDGIELFFLQVGVASSCERGDILSVEPTEIEGSRGVIVVVPVVVAGAWFESDRAVDGCQQAGGERRFAGVNAGVAGDE